MPGFISTRPQVADPRVGAQWLRFTLVGASNTVVYAAVYMTLERVGVQYVAASIIAFAIGALNSYGLNRRWTFRSNAPRAPELARFVCAQLLGVVASLALLAALVEVARFHHLAAQAIAFPVGSLITFALSRQWAFASGYPRAPAAMRPPAGRARSGCRTDPRAGSAGRPAR